MTTDIMFGDLKVGASVIWGTPGTLASSEPTYRFATIEKLGEKTVQVAGTRYSRQDGRPQSRSDRSFILPCDRELYGHYWQTAEATRKKDEKDRIARREHAALRRTPAYRAAESILCRDSAALVAAFTEAELVAFADRLSKGA